MNRVIAIYTVVSVSAVGLLIWAIGPGHDLMGRRNTTYAKGYSESAFDAVNVGMTREEVIQLLGDPMDVTVTREGRQPISVTLGEDVLPKDKLRHLVIW